MRIVFVYWGPHPIHKTVVKSVTNEAYSYLPNLLLNRFKDKPPLAHQLLSLISNLEIPQADVYILEGMACLPAILTKRKKAKIISLNADNFFYKLLGYKGYKRSIYSWYASQIDGLLSISNYAKEFADKCLQVPNEVFSLGIKEKFFSLKADLTQKTIGALLCTLTYLKGVDIALKSFNKLENGYKLLLMGPLKENIQELREYQDNHQVTVTGWTEEPEKNLLKCGTYINPARFEPFGLNIIEAMAVGIPPIVTHFCGAKEAVEKVSKDLVVAPEASQIAAKIKWLNSDLARKQQLGEKSRLIAADYTEEKSISSFKKAFNNLLASM